MEPHSTSWHARGRRWRLGASLALLALVAAGLYGATLWRFGVIMGGG